MPLFDEAGQRIRGKENKERAEQALARVKLADRRDGEEGPAYHGAWLVAQVASEYLEYCSRGLTAGTISQGHQRGAVAFLNDLCQYCGALRVSELNKGHIKIWLESHETWKSPATHRGVIAFVQAAFNYAEQMHGVANPLKGLKRPPGQPRLHSFSAEEEQAIYKATEQCFGNFLFAAIYTGLRPFCELAQMTADQVEENGRGMMWRVYSTKTKKTRKIPVRPEVAELTRRLMETAPKGSGIKLFRNTQGKPWKRMTGVARFLALKRKLGWDQDPLKRKYSCYSCRHTFAHRMLSGYWNGGAGCSIETLAELIGDTPKVAFDHYGKEWGQHYQDPLWAAVGGGNEPKKRPAEEAEGKETKKPAKRPGRRSS